MRRIETSVRRSDATGCWRAGENQKAAFFNGMRHPIELGVLGDHLLGRFQIEVEHGRGPRLDRLAGKRSQVLTTSS